MPEFTESARNKVGAETPLRIFVGTDESQVVQFRVLEYSIRKSATIPVQIEPMADLPGPKPLTAEDHPFARFSFYRLMIPALAGYEGRALYLDAESLVLGDVAELAALPFCGHSILCSPPDAPGPSIAFASTRPSDQRTVVLIDCDQLRRRMEELASALQAGSYAYDELLEKLCTVDPEEVAETVPREWGHVERYEAGLTKLLHFRKECDQPWTSARNPLAAIWIAYYEEAAGCGAVTPEEIEASVSSGHLKPSLQQILPISSRLQYLSRPRNCRPALAEVQADRSKTVRLDPPIALSSERSTRRQSIRAAK